MTLTQSYPCAHSGNELKKDVNGLLLDLQSCGYNMDEGDKALKQHYGTLKRDHAKSWPQFQFAHMLGDIRAMPLRIAAVDTEEKWDSFLALAAPAACASKVYFLLLIIFCQPE